MTFLSTRGRRTLGTLCAAALLTAGLPVGAAVAADATIAQTEPKLEEALKKAPELKGATFDISDVRFAPAGITPRNEKFTGVGRHMFFDHSAANPLNPNDPNQPNQTLTSLSQSWAHTETETYTRTHEFGTSLAIGREWETSFSIEGLASEKVTTSVELSVSYEYSTSTTTTTTDTTTVTSSPQNVQVRPGHAVRVRQYVDIGKYEADLTLHGILTGNVLIKKCGKTASVPVGRLLAMKRDEGQDPLLPDTIPDGDVARQTAVVHWSTDFAAMAVTEVTDTLLSSNQSTVTTTPDTPAGSSSQATAKSASAPAARSLASEPVKTLRSVVPCASTMDLDTSGGAPREGTPLPVGTIAVGNHTFLTPDKRLVYEGWTVDRDVASVVGAWASETGRDWASYVRDDGRAYTWLLDSRSPQFDMRFPAGTRAVGFHAYLTPDGDLFIDNRRVAQRVTSAIGGWSATDWISFVSDGKGYAMTRGMASPREEGTYPAGTRAVGNHTYLAPDGSLSYGGKVIATGVTSALGGWGHGDDWITFIADGRGHSTDGGRIRISDEVALPDGASVVGNHTYLDPDGYLYYVRNEVARNVTSAVGGWGPGPDWATYTTEDR